MKTYNRERHLKAISGFHKHQARMPFDEKVRVLIRLQEVASGWGTRPRGSSGQEAAELHIEELRKNILPKTGGAAPRSEATWGSQS